MRNMKIGVICSLVCIFSMLHAQPSREYWQQEIAYVMQIDMDVRSNQYVGTSEIRYRNNSPDALTRLYFHLYFNAFQPGSDMDVRSRSIPDPDPRIGSRIFSLKPEEQGFQNIQKIWQNGKELKFEIKGTILEVTPVAPVKPGQTIKLKLEYKAQVPIQIRRSGRDNAEGIRYSMAQWYPKMCEYDQSGWHTDPYIGREFYGVWGKFDVTIRIDSAYTVGATGTLLNKKEIAHGYGGKPVQKSAKTTWHFYADHVHDFVWTADPDYIHEVYTCKNGVVFHTFYQDHELYTRNWKKLPAIMEEAINYANEHFGVYAYPSFSIIQGGDGGMEYPMATLITGNRPLNSLVGVTVHEFMHSWYYNMLGFNESLYYWMDEGFTSYAENRVIEHLKAKGLIPGDPSPFPFDGDIKNYYTIVTRGIEEPLSTHADHFEFNSAYSFAAYGKGSIFLHQLEYLVGTKPFDSGLLEFFNSWKFRHPTPNDLLHIMEKRSGLQLDWYEQYMVHTTKTIDYSIDTLWQEGKHARIQLSNYSNMPMPVDVRIKQTNGTITFYTIPLDLMLGAKSQLTPDGKTYQVLTAWDWVNPEYIMELPISSDQVAEIEIDPFHFTADLDRTNNTWPPTAATND